MSLNRICYNFIGLWPDEKTSTLNASKRFIVPFMILSLTIWITFPMNYALTQVVEEFPLLIDNLMTNFAIVKIYLLWRGRKSELITIIIFKSKLPWPNFQK